MFDYEQLMLFVEAAQSLNFSAVARRFYITQPAVSRQISSLEQKLGMQLFSRTGNRVVLTREGEAFLTEARKILLSMQEAQRHMNNIKEGREGHIAIACVISEKHILTQCLALFSKECPGVTVDIFVMNGDEMRESLVRGTLDFCFGQDFLFPVVNTTNMDYLVSGEDRLCFVVPETHWLSEFPKDFSVLTDEPFIIVNELYASPLNRKIMELCGSYNYLPKVINRHNRPEVILLSVSAGIGISILTENIFRNCYTEDVRYILFPDDSARLCSVIVRRKNTENLAAERFWGIAKHIYPSRS